MAIIETIDLYDSNNKHKGIFKIDVLCDKGVANTLFVADVPRVHNDSVINSFFGQISIKSMDIYSGGINAFNDFKLNIYSKDDVKSDLKVTISSTTLKHSGIYDTTTSSGSQLRINTDGSIQRYSSSSKRYKKDITSNLPSELNPQKLYDLNIVSYKYKDNYLPYNDQRYEHNILGFIAEDVYEIYPEACNLNEDGSPEMWEINILFPAALKLIQQQHKEITSLTEQLEAMKQQFQELKKYLDN